jgi:hypothetical protein
MSYKNEHFAWRGARALREMSIRDETVKSLCIGLRAHETLAKAMDNFKESSMVQAQCLRAIGTLCYKNELVGFLLYIYLRQLLLRQTLLFLTNRFISLRFVGRRASSAWCDGSWLPLMPSRETTP